MKHTAQRRYVIPSRTAVELEQVSGGPGMVGAATTKKDSPRGGLTSVARGRLAEEAAADFLRERGHEVLARNYRTPIGEVDIVAREGSQTVVVEVKARSGGSYGSALEAIGPMKERRLRGVAAWWMAEHGQAPRGIRFDVITVHLGQRGDLLALYHLRDVLGSGR